MENHHQEQEHHQYVPYEILTDILFRLPADSILRFKLVCKAWQSIIEEDSVFYDMCLRRLLSSASTTSSSNSLGLVTLETVKKFGFYTYNVCIGEYKHDDDDDDHQKVVMKKIKKRRLPFKDQFPDIHEDMSEPWYSCKIVYEKVTIVGSCNGLICISVIPDYDSHGTEEFPHQMLVCNPLTNEVVNLPDSSITYSLFLVGIGFGYLPSTNEYKCVRIYASSSQVGEDMMKLVRVYTLGSSCSKWRSIFPQISSSEWWSPITQFSFGVSVNGALYFNEIMNIRSFDLATEEFRIVVSPPPPPPPPPLPPFTTYIGELGVLEGRLCATFSKSFDISSTITMTNTDGWVLMEEKKDDKETWIKKFSLPPQREGPMNAFYGYRPLGTISHSPRILLQSIPSQKKGIVSYNPETDHLCCRDIKGGKRKIIPYVKSCVSLKALEKHCKEKSPYVKSCVSLKALGKTLQGKIGEEEESAREIRF